MTGKNKLLTKVKRWRKRDGKRKIDKRTIMGKTVKKERELKNFGSRINPQ